MVMFKTRKYKFILKSDLLKTKQIYIKKNRHVVMLGQAEVGHGNRLREYWNFRARAIGRYARRYIKR